MIKKYRKKPVVIEAMEWIGTYSNKIELSKFMLSGVFVIKSGELYISTLEGEHKANVGDFIIKRGAREFYTYKPDVFRATYEEVEG